MSARLSDMLADAESTRVQCSRAGCRADARWRIQWRNPRIHAADRTKSWTACDAHLDYLREFLAARDFPLEVSALVARG